MKPCSVCQVEKTLDEFPRDSQSRSDGRSGRCKTCNVARNLAWREKNPTARREYHLQYKYGLSVAERDELRRSQADQCAICGADSPRCVDHDHESGRVRGLLCSACNLVLGHAADDPARLRAAAAYLEAPRG